MGVIRAYGWLTGLIAALIVLQAFLAGEWLAGNNAIKVHGAIGLALVALSLAQLALAIAARAAGPDRRTLLSLSSLLLALMIVQLVLGEAGADHADQARPFHLSIGVLLFGIAGSSAVVAQRLRRHPSESGDR
ncbi:MAG TPA: hypothetical protein VFA70_06440 [Dehalococcoidia bacterium]|nr:hypothetical protein [Dehalococcoidia bacterium]